MLISPLLSESLYGKCRANPTTTASINPRLDSRVKRKLWTSQAKADYLQDESHAASALFVSPFDTSHDIPVLLITSRSFAMVTF